MNPVYVSVSYHETNFMYCNLPYVFSERKFSTTAPNKKRVVDSHGNKESTFGSAAMAADCFTSPGHPLPS